MTIVPAILKQMPAVSQPQRKFLAVLFVTILTLRGRVTLGAIKQATRKFYSFSQNLWNNKGLGKNCIPIFGGDFRAKKWEHKIAGRLR